MKKSIISFFILALIFFSDNAFAHQRQDPAQMKVEVEVNLLQIQVIVIGVDGKAIGGLLDKNFRFTICPIVNPLQDINAQRRRRKERGGEDCVVVKVRPHLVSADSIPPLRARLLFDTSNSTRNYLKALAVPTVEQILKTLVSDNGGINLLEPEKRDAYSIWPFSEGPEEIIQWTTDTSTAENALRSLRSGGLSAIFDTIFLCADNAAQADGKYLTNFCIMVTDGFDTIRHPVVDGKTGRACSREKLVSRSPDCREVKIEDIVARLQISETRLYVVDFSKRYDKRELQSSFRKPLNSEDDLGTIAALSGGERIFVKDPEKIAEPFREIAEKMKKSYTLGVYVPKTPVHEWYDIYVEVGEWKTDKNGNEVFEVNQKLTDRAAYRKRWHVEK